MAEVGLRVNEARSLDLADIKWPRWQGLRASRRTGG
jgi:hypothetical protein